MKNVRKEDIKREWHLIDANNKVLGRISSNIATLLMGKGKAYYTPHLDTGDNVVVINAKKVMITGKKETQKVYYRHSGYPGGLYKKTVKDIRSSKPEDLIRKAVTGMLPKTKLGRTMVKKLHIFPESEHSHKDRFKG